MFFSFFATFCLFVATFLTLFLLLVVKDELTRRIENNRTLSKRDKSKKKNIKKDHTFKTTLNNTLTPLVYSHNQTTLNNTLTPLVYSHNQTKQHEFT